MLVTGALESHKNSIYLFLSLCCYLSTYTYIRGFTKLGIKVLWRLQVLEYLRTLHLKFQKARTKIEVVLSLPCWLSQFSWDSQQGRLRTTSTLVRAFWNFKCKVLKYSRTYSLHNSLIPNLVKPLMYKIFQTKLYFYLSRYSRWSRSIKKMPKQNNLAKILKVTPESKTYYHTQFEGQIRFAVWDTSPGWVPITLACIKNVCINVHMFKKNSLSRKDSNLLLYGRVVCSVGHKSKL